MHIALRGLEILPPLCIERQTLRPSGNWRVALDGRDFQGYKYVTKWLHITQASTSRRSIVEKLARKRLSVNEIAAGFDMSRPALSKHLKVLEGCGILTREIVGRDHLCAIDPRAICAASSWFERHERFWNSVLDSLDKHLEKKK